MNGGAPYDSSQDSLRLVVGSGGLTAPAHPVDVTPAVHRMRAASLDAQWHALLADVYDHCLEPVPS